MRAAVVALLALALGGCADAAFHLAPLALDLASGAQFPQSRPVCPAGVDPKAVTWCRIVPVETVHE